MVASVALFVVLDRLGVGDAARRCPRGCAWGLFCNLVAAAVLVYNLGAHVVGRGDGKRGRRGRSAVAGEGDAARRERQGGAGRGRRRRR